MLKKPFILNLLIIAISTLLGITVALVLLPFGIKNNTSSGMIATYFAAYYAGMIYVNTYKEELTKQMKIKTVLYYSVSQLVLVMGICLLLAKVQSKLIPFPLILTISLIFITIAGFLVYGSLGRGCRAKLKELEKKGLLKTEQEA